MSRLIAKFLLVSMLVPCLFLLGACKNKNVTPQPTPGPKPDPEEKAPALYIPTQDSFPGHSTQNFENFIYSAPSVETLVQAFTIAETTLKDGTTDYDEALQTVASAEALYAEYTSMYAFARYSYAKDNTNTYFAEEYKRLYESTPSVAAAIDRLFCAVAASQHVEALSKTKYFATDIAARYQNGGIYTEETLPLFEQECALNLSLLTISYDTISVTLNGKTDTVTNLLNEMAQIYGDDSAEYQKIATACHAHYNKAAATKRAEIYVSLVRVRRAIADALGYHSYADLATDRLGYSADTDEIKALLTAIETYILPIYQDLSASDYFSSTTGKLEKIKFPETMLNTLTRFYETKGGKIFEGYNYLLHRSLFSLNQISSKTAQNTFSLYFADRKQPYIYICSENSAADYLSVADALGSSLYYYQSAVDGSAFSDLFCAPETEAAYASALRLLTLLGMKEALSKTESSLVIPTYQVLLKNEMYSLFRTALTQSMRTEIEKEVYALEANEISESAINAIISRAADRFDCFEMKDGGITSLTLTSEGLLTPEMFESPMKGLGDLYSAYIAVSLFAMESRQSGSGFTAYEALLSAGSAASLTAALGAMGLPAPTSTGRMQALAADVYEILTGYTYHSGPPALTSLRAA